MCFGACHRASGLFSEAVALPGSLSLSLYLFLSSSVSLSLCPCLCLCICLCLSVFLCYYVQNVCVPLSLSLLSFGSSSSLFPLPSLKAGLCLCLCLSRCYYVQNVCVSLSLSAFVWILIFPLPAPIYQGWSLSMFLSLSVLLGPECLCVPLSRFRLDPHLLSSRSHLSRLRIQSRKAREALRI